MKIASINEGSIVDTSFWTIFQDRYSVALIRKFIDVIGIK